MLLLLQKWNIIIFMLGMEAATLNCINIFFEGFPSYNGLIESIKRNNPLEPWDCLGVLCRGDVSVSSFLMCTS